MDLFPATLDGYTLEIETLDDQFEKAIARYEIPYRDGAILEDMGQKARTVRIRCYFWDDGADHFTYADHIDVVNHLESKALFHLVHPKYGPMDGCVESMAVRHDDRIMAAEVDISFVEDLRARLADVQYDDVATATAGAFLAAQEEQALAFAAELAATLGSESGAILAQTLDPALPVIDQFTGISLKARLHLKTVDAYVRGVENTLTEIANPANSLIAAIAYGDKLPGRVVGATTRCLERYALLLNTADTTPARFAASFHRSVLDLAATLGNLSQLIPGGAALLALLMAGFYKEDEGQRSQLRRNEQIPGFDLAGRRLSQSLEQPVMTVNELEDSLAQTRGLIQSAIDLDRTQTALKTQARLLLEHVNTIKLEREKIVAVTVANPLPLHLVCLAHGLPYTYAERIHSINRIPQPSFTRGEVSIYGR